MLTELLQGCSGIGNVVRGLGSLSGDASVIAFVVLAVLVVWAAALWVVEFVK